MMKLISFLFLFAILFSQNSEDIMDQFVYEHLLITKSKMESSPLVWQDLKEGYLRNYTIRYADILLDSLDRGQISSFDASIRHFDRIESLRKEISKGEEFEYLINKKNKSNYNINYFSSSIE